MRRVVIRSPAGLLGDSTGGQLPIALGLAWLMLVSCLPATPAVTAMALVGLGATDALLARVGGNANRLPIAVAHGLVYGGLYILFAGAALHGNSLNTGYGAVVGLDLAASTLPLALTIQRISRA